MCSSDLRMAADPATADRVMGLNTMRRHQRLLITTAIRITTPVTRIIGGPDSGFIGAGDSMAAGSTVDVSMADADSMAGDVWADLPVLAAGLATQPAVAVAVDKS